MLSKAQASLPYRTLKTTGIIAIISNHSISKSWLTMSPKRATISSPGPFRRLITELLDVVLNEILNSKGRSGLLSISLVSRYFYIHSVPHLYRYIVLDLNRFSHQILLARLAQPGSRLPGKIREPHISGIKAKHSSSMQRISAIVARLQHLEGSSWSDGSPEVPECILDELHGRFPRARIIISASRSESDVPAAELPCQLSFQSITTHPAAAGLTRFALNLETDERLYDGFKNHLITMLHRSTLLRDLQVSSTYSINRVYPEMLDALRTNELPQSEILVLETTGLELFTRQELFLWGSKGGWANLHTLQVHGVRHVIPFAGHSLKLNILSVSSQNKEDYDQLENYLDRTARSILLRQSRR